MNVVGVIDKVVSVIILHQSQYELHYSEDDLDTDIADSDIVDSDSDGDGNEAGDYEENSRDGSLFGPVLHDYAMKGNDQECDCCYFDHLNWEKHASIPEFSILEKRKLPFGVRQ